MRSLGSCKGSTGPASIDPGTGRPYRLDFPELSLEDVGDASVYGTLRRLYASGALTSYVVPSDEGPHRKYYGINDSGRAALDEQTATWAHFADTMGALLKRREVHS